MLLLPLKLHQPRLQDLHRRDPVLVLGALVLALHDDVGGQVRDAHRAVGLVDVLAARPRRPVGVHLEVLLVHLDLDGVVDDRGDRDRGEAGVPAPPRVERADAHQAVDA